MKRFTTLFLVSGLALLGIVTAPDLMLSPGELVRGHASLRDDCLSCHALLRGTPDGRCIACHDPLEIDAKRTGPGLHRTLVIGTCLSCHSDHRGPEPGSATAAFAHENLQRELAEQCESCHRAPVDRLHSSFEGACAPCHTSDRWDRASFDHDRYFRFDRHHPADCASCHPAGRLDEYSCYECHAHSPGNMVREHREEGIRDFERCVDCHRSGDEDEAERRWRAIRRGALPGSGTGIDSREAAKRRYSQGRYGDSDDDDDEDSDDEDSDDDDD